MSSREVEKEGSNFCESRANTSQIPAPFRDVTTRQKQRPRGPIQASPEKRERVSLHTPPGESLPLPAPLHPGPRVPLDTSPGAARVRKAAAPHHGRRYRQSCQPSSRPARGRDGSARGRREHSLGAGTQRGCCGPAWSHGPEAHPAPTWRSRWPVRARSGTGPCGPAEARAPGQPSPTAAPPPLPRPGPGRPLPARSAPAAPGRPARSRRGAGAGG